MPPVFRCGRRMNIACDARALVGPATGVGVWTREIMAGLAETGRFRILAAASKSFEMPERFRNLPVETLPPPPFPVPGTLWLHSRLPAMLKDADLFVASLAVLPRRCPVPGIVMLHDLTPRNHPQRHTLANRFCFNAYLEESLDEAAAVVVGSESTRREALEVFPWIEPKLRKIGYGVDGYYRPPEWGRGGGEEVRRKFSSGRPYILYLGTLEPRKGLETLLHAWEENAARRADCPDLVLAGREGWGVTSLLRRLESSVHRSRIHRPGYVSREDGRALMQHAEVFVLPSEAEGFGLPLAEAVCCGAACVASDIPPLRESGADAPLFVPPRNEEALARALEEALEPSMNAVLRERSRRRSGGLSWEIPVRAWSELLEGLSLEAR